MFLPFRLQGIGFLFTLIKSMVTMVSVWGLRNPETEYTVGSDENHVFRCLHDAWLVRQFSVEILNCEINTRLKGGFSLSKSWFRPALCHVLVLNSRTLYKVREQLSWGWGKISRYCLGPFTGSQEAFVILVLGASLGCLKFSCWFRSEWRSWLPIRFSGNTDWICQLAHSDVAPSWPGRTHLTCRSRPLYIRRSCRSRPWHCSSCIAHLASIFVPSAAYVVIDACYLFLISVLPHGISASNAFLVSFVCVFELAVFFGSTR
jgi:hypothetical protein